MKPIDNGVEAAALGSNNERHAFSPIPPAPAPPAPVYPRTITKESLRADSGSSTPSSSPPTHEDPTDEHSFQSSLFDFSILDLDNKESELLSLPLTFIELPITPPLFEQPRGVSASTSFDTPPAAVATAPSPNASRLLSTAAAIARVSSAAHIRPAPPIVTVAAYPPPSQSKPKHFKQQQRVRTVSTVSQTSSGSPRAAPAVSSSRAQFASRRPAPRPATKRHTMEPQPPPPLQTPLLVPALPPRPASAPSAPAIHPRGGPPLPPRKYAPAPAPHAAHGALVPAAPSYHHAHPPPAAAHHQPRPHIPSGNGHALPPAVTSAQAAAAVVNTVSAVHPTTGQVENTGRWTAEEHRLFLQGLEAHGKGWKKIATLIKSRTVVQIRTHAQKYFQKLAKARQNGEVVAGVHAQPHGGQAVLGHHLGGGGMVAPQGHATLHMGMAEGGDLGIAVPVGPDGQPVVTMRTTTHPGLAGPPPHLQAHGANMSLGCDATSLAAAAGRVDIAGAAHRGGRRRKGAGAPGGGTKRRAIGNVVRSAVREGRNVKRQRSAEGPRKGQPAPAARAGAVALGRPPRPTDDAEVPNPLPSVSNVLDPYVTTNAAVLMRNAHAPGAAGAAQGKKNGRGRQQLVHTATHGTLPMAVLEDAVFRLLTPATGASSPPPVQRQPQADAANSANLELPHAPASSKVPVAHSQYHPPAPTSSTAYAQGVPNGMSPTGVTEMSLLPSWVDTKNPPSWYNDGSDIDTLLEDADYLNWLGDTGDLEETYPPAMAEPSAVVSGPGRAPINCSEVVIPMPEPAPVAAAQDPTDGLVHPSADSLSFLVDAPEECSVADAPSAMAAPLALKDQGMDVGRLPLFLDDDSRTPPPMVLSHSLLTGAVAVTSDPDDALVGAGESDTNLMGFPDLDMGDEQAFVSALLENSGQSTMSFPKLASDMHMSQVNMSGASGNSAIGLSAGEEHETQDKLM